MGIICIFVFGNIVFKIKDLLLNDFKLKSFIDVDVDLVEDIEFIEG